MADYEQRLARLEGKTGFAQATLSMLAEDYAHQKDLVMQSQQDLEVVRRKERKAVEDAKEAKIEYETEEAALLYIETNPDGKINGKNDTIRKHQTAELLASARAEGGALFGSWTKHQEMERALASMTVEKEVRIDHFSAVRNVMRLAAGLAYGLGR